MNRSNSRPPRLRPEDLQVLTPSRRRLGGVEGEPAISFPGDGRFVLNTAATARLSPDKPVHAVRLYLSKDKKHPLLVVAPTDRSDKTGISVFRTGIREGAGRWPTVVMGRSNRLIFHDLRIVDRVRFAGMHDMEHNWLVFNLDEPIRYSLSESKDPVGDLLGEWVKRVKKRPYEVSVGELHKQLLELAKEKRLLYPFPKGSATPLSSYLRVHATQLADEHRLSLRGFGARAAVVLV